MGFRGLSIDYDAAIAGGAYDMRMYQKNFQDNSLTPTVEEQQVADALKEKLKGVTVTMSPEAVAFMEGIRERKEAQRAEEERMSKEWDSSFNSENAFDRIGSYFNIISDELSEMGFYDNLSDEEALQMDHLLAGITYGMNSVGGNVKEARYEQLSSYAASFELESSTAALKQFSEKYVPSEMKDKFNDLIGQYYEHNAKALKGYRSSEEYMLEGMAWIYDTTASKRAIPLSEEEKFNWKLGKVKTEEADYASAAESWNEQFKMLVNGEKSVDDAITMMQDTLNALASGNSENRGLLAYVSQWNSFSIENARDYWKLLV